MAFVELEIRSLTKDGQEAQKVGVDPHPDDIFYNKYSIRVDSISSFGQSTTTPGHTYMEMMTGSDYLIRGNYESVKKKVNEAVEAEFATLDQQDDYEEMNIRLASKEEAERFMAMIRGHFESDEQLAQAIRNHNDDATSGKDEEK